MNHKTAGWIIIGFSIIIGVLRLLNVIDNSVTAVLWMLGVIMIMGALMGARKKKQEEAVAEQPEKEE